MMQGQGVVDDPCVLKKDCSICRAFTPEQLQHLATPIYRTRKEKEQKQTVSASPVTAAPHFHGPFTSQCVGVEGEKADMKPEITPAGKKK